MVEYTQNGKIFSFGPYKFLVDTGATLTSFPGYYNPDTQCIEVLDPISMLPTTSVDLPTWPLETNTGGGKVQDAKLLISHFDVKMDGMRPISVKYLEVSPIRLKPENAKPTLVLGRDVLFQLSGFWSQSNDSKMYLHLEDGFECNQETNSVFDRVESIVENVSDRAGVDSVKRAFNTATKTIVDLVKRKKT